MSYSLVLLNGPNPGALIPLEETADSVTIGRDAGCELPIDDHLCSRRHARVWFDGRQWSVEDAGSQNGTFVNAQPIQRATLQAQDVIRVGDHLVAFVNQDQPAGKTGLGPAHLAMSTFIVRVAAPQQQQQVIEQAQIESGNGQIRRAAILCRFARQLHRFDNTTSLMEAVSTACTEATSADETTVWLVGADGRLRCSVRSHANANANANAGANANANAGAGANAGADGDAGADANPAVAQDPHVLATLAIENNEALLIQHPVAADKAGGEQELGTAISVPIPGRSGRRGAIECRRRGARGAFQREDLDMAITLAHQAGLALENLEYRERLEQANQILRETVADQTRIVGESPAVNELLEKISRVASTTSTVLVLGESGTGKELVSRLLHDSSARSAGPFIAVNCAAFSESLLESELFGHEQGAFTGAERRRIGQFERAHRGTLFLDEVGEMSLGCQVKLLRVLEGHPIERVGGGEPLQLDIRVVAATHRQLPELIKTGRFREDLYYRLRVIELCVPPLRERGDDVLTLAVHFLEHFRRQTGRGPSRLSEATSRAVMEYHWPGNVRELKNAIERAVVLGMDDEMQVGDLGLPSSQADDSNPGVLVSLTDAERRHIDAVLQRVDGNKTQACRILGIGRGTLYQKLKRS